MQIKNSYVIKSWILVEHFFFNYVFTLCADLRSYSMRLRRFTFLLQLPTDVSVTWSLHSYVWPTHDQLHVIIYRNKRVCNQLCHWDLVEKPKRTSLSHVKGK